VKRLIKLLHEVGGIGMTGALAVQLVLLARAVHDPAEPAYATLRSLISDVHDWLLFPSLTLVLVSGLAAMAAHYPFAQARWVWLKAITGIALFEGTLVTVIGTGRRLAEAATIVSAGGTLNEPVFAALLRTERLALWVIFALAVLNVVLGVMRPRLQRRSETMGAPPAAQASACASRSPRP
jgi:uncharacterized membrane protein YgdD (TMEM256/DUF423 family)